MGPDLSFKALVSDLTPFFQGFGSRLGIMGGMSVKVRSFVKRRGAGLIVVVALMICATIFTRPLLAKGSDHVYKEPYDPMFQAWTLAWDAHAVIHSPSNLFNANIFFPNADTLTYSDHQIVTAVMALPVLSITGNPLQTANYMLVFNLFLCAIGSYLLVVHLTKNRVAGLVAGMIFAFAAPRLAQITHLQLSAAAFIPLCLLFLHKYSEDGHVHDAALAALFFVLETLSTWYYGMILAFAVLVFIAVRFVMKPRAFTFKWTVSLLLVFAIAAGLVAPFAIPYLKVHEKDARFERTISEVDMFSADIQDFGAATENNLVWGPLTASLRAKTTSRGGETERTLFVGLMPILLGIAGAVYLFIRGKGAQRFDVRFYVTLIVASFLMCLGSTLYLFGHSHPGVPMPYRLFYNFFPGFKVMRVPARFIILVLLGLAVLSGFAVKAMLSWLSERRRGNRVLPVVVTVLILALLVVDLMSINLPMRPMPSRDKFPEVYTWLKDQSGQAPTAEIPLANYNPRTFSAGLQYEPTWAEREGLRTYYSTLHWKKIFNGYSGFLPTSYYDGVRAASEFPSDRAIVFLRKEGIKYVIVHGKELEPTVVASVLAYSEHHSGFKLLRDFGSDYVFDISTGEQAHRETGNEGRAGP